MSCERCGGFKVFDYFYGPLPCNGFRCVNCGAITDMQVIMPARVRTVDSSRNRMGVGRRQPLFASPEAARVDETPQ